MPDQLRMYTIRPGEMAAWLEEWGRQIAPLRRRLGFEILGAWTAESDHCIWILRYKGPKPWEEADAAYYASSERTAMQPDPARHIAKSEHWLMSAVDVKPADQVIPSAGDGSISATEVITYAGALVTLAGRGARRRLGGRGDQVGLASAAGAWVGGRSSLPHHGRDLGRGRGVWPAAESVVGNGGAGVRRPIDGHHHRLYHRPGRQPATR